MEKFYHVFVPKNLKSKKQTFHLFIGTQRKYTFLTQKSVWSNTSETEGTLSNINDKIAHSTRDHNDQFCHTESRINPVSIYSS